MRFKKALLSFAASLVVVNPSGQAIWNVLALEVPQSESLEVKNAPVSSSPLALVKDGDQLLLNDLNVTDFKDILVEIEERPQVQKLTIKSFDHKFALEQEGVAAVTDYAINIDPTRALVSVTTTTGAKYLSLFPKAALDSALRAQALDEPVGNLNLIEDNQVLVYQIQGHRILNLFNLINYPVPVSVKVSAATGEVIFIDQPQWFRVLGFLFS